MGGWELDLLEPLYIETPIIAQFLKGSNIQVRKNHFFHLLIEHVLDIFCEKLPLASKIRQKGEINMAIVFPNRIEQNITFEYLRNLYKQVLLKKNNAWTGDIFICGYESMKIIDYFLIYAGRKIDIMVEMLNGGTEIKYMEAVKKGNLVLCNGPVTRIMSNKLNLALLSEYQDSEIFNLEERELIKKHIPWTRKIIHVDREFLLAQRERLVLKSAEGLGGHDVFPGWRMAAEEWQQKIEKAREEKRWVVQEYVPSSQYLYQYGKSGCTEHHAVWGLFVLGSRYAGGFVRVMPAKNNTGVINTAQGAEESIIIEVEES